MNQGGRIGFLEGGDVDTLKDLYKKGLSQENIAIELNTSRADITRNIKKLKDQNILKDRDVLEVTKKNPKFLKKVKDLRNILQKEIKEFDKNKILPKEKYTANLTELGKKMKVSSKAIENYLAEIKDLDFDVYGSGEAAPTQLSIKDQNKFKKHYKDKTIAQMAREITGKELSNKETRAVFGKLERFRDTLDKKGLINKKDSLIGFKERPLGYKGTSGESFRKQELKQKKLAAKDPNISKNPKYFKKSGEFSPRKLDTELLKFLNMDTVKGSLDPKFPKFLKPSYEHIQGITPGDIIGDSEALRKVDIATRRYNFKEMGAKSNLYRDVKNYLRTAQAAIKNNEMGIADEALKVVNDIYTKTSNKFPNLDRKDLPNYSIKDGIVKETNLKGLIQPKKIEDSFKTYFKNVADTTTKSELETIKRVQPNAFKVIDLFQKGKVNEGYNFIKTRMPSVKGGGKFAVPILAGGAALNFLTSPAEAAEAQASETGVVDKAKSWTIEHPWLTGGAGVAATAATKPGKQVLSKTLKGLGGIDLPLVQAAFAYDDPTNLAYSLPFTKVAADVTGITKPAATKTGQVAKNVLSGIGPKRLAKYALPVSRISTPFGIGMLGYDIAKHSKPNYYIDPQTQDPTFYDRENASDVLPTMIDIYDQAYNLAKKENISYQEALNKVNPERFYKLKND
tara:strand:+ start:21 stop:2060 length:2040 start_codon:yes stop_codon:yes gene_type:complete